MERWFCLNCEAIGGLSRNGRCMSCDSDAVASEFAHNLAQQGSWIGFREWAAEAIRQYRQLAIQ